MFYTKIFTWSPRKNPSSFNLPVYDFVGSSQFLNHYGQPLVSNTWNQYMIYIKWPGHYFSWIIVCIPNTMTAAPTPILSAFTEAENESSTTLLSNGSEPCSLNESPSISWELDLESWLWLDWVELVEISGAPELAWSCGPRESSYSSWCDDEDFGIVFKSAAQKALPATCNCCSVQPNSWHQADFLLQSCRK